MCAAFVFFHHRKENAQDRALGLLLLAARYGLLLLAGTNLAVSWIVVLFLSGLHMLFNWLAARTLQLKVKGEEHRMHLAKRELLNRNPRLPLPAAMLAF